MGLMQVMTILTKVIFNWT